MKKWNRVLGVYYSIVWGGVRSFSLAAVCCRVPLCLVVSEHKAAPVSPEFKL